MIKRGQLTLIRGPMFADKTTTLIRMQRGASISGIRTAVIRPSNDIRYSLEHIVSHSGDSLDAFGCDPEKLFEYVQNLDTNDLKTVFIDEGHFFPSLVVSVQFLLEKNIDVVVAGIDIDYKRQPFANMLGLEKIAKNHVVCRAICTCGKFASYTKMKKELQAAAGEIVVGGSDKYAAYCGDAICEAYWP